MVFLPLKNKKIRGAIKSPHHDKMINKHKENEMYKQKTYKSQRKTAIKKDTNAELKKKIKELKKQILRNKIQAVADYIKERI